MTESKPKVVKKKTKTTKTKQSKRTQKTPRPENSVWNARTQKWTKVKLKSGKKNRGQLSLSKITGVRAPPTLYSQFVQLYWAKRKKQGDDSGKSNSLKENAQIILKEFKEAQKNGNIKVAEKQIQIAKNAYYDATLKYLNENKAAFDPNKKSSKQQTLPTRPQYKKVVTQFNNFCKRENKKCFNFPQGSRSSYILFTMDFRKKNKAKIDAITTDKFRVVAEMLKKGWEGLTTEKKENYNSLAKKEIIKRNTELQKWLNE